MAKLCMELLLGEFICILLDVVGMIFHGGSVWPGGIGRVSRPVPTIVVGVSIDITLFISIFSGLILVIVVVLRRYMPVIAQVSVYLGWSCVLTLVELRQVRVSCILLTISVLVLFVIIRSENICKTNYQYTTRVQRRTYFYTVFPP